MADVAEISSLKLEGEVRRLKSHFRRKALSLSGGCIHMIAIITIFCAVVLFMRIFPRRNF